LGGFRDWGCGMKKEYCLYCLHYHLGYCLKRGRREFVRTLPFNQACNDYEFFMKEHPFYDEKNERTKCKSQPDNK